MSIPSTGFLIDSIWLSATTTVRNRKTYLGRKSFMKIRVYALKKWSRLLPLIGMCGCSGVALRHDFTDYSAVYGDASNNQLLLNLARESHQEPVYFLQLASISSQYHFNASGGFSTAWSHTSTADVAPLMGGLVTRILTLGGNIGAGASQQPVFQFLPLAGSNFVDIVLAPTPPNIFWRFYNEGWPADWVARTMLESIQIKVPNADGSTNCHLDVYANDPSDPSYPQFLEYCKELYDAQRFHILEAGKIKNDAGETIVYEQTNATLKDVVTAVKAGLTVKRDKSGVYTYYMAKTNESSGESPSLLITDENSLVSQFYEQEKELAPPGLTRPDFEKSVHNAITLAKEICANPAVLSMRTFEETLNGVASEQNYFSTNNNVASAGKSISFTNDMFGTVGVVKNPGVPTFTVRPILMIRYRAAARSHLSKLAEIKYEDEVYTVGDLKAGYADPQEKFLEGFQGYRSDDIYGQNSMVFSMPSYLFYQAAIDTSKLPVQQLIQVQ
jgi:hypothetical protein